VIRRPRDRPLRQRGVHRLDDDAAAPVQAKVAYPPQHRIRGRGREIELHRVPVRPGRGRPQHHEPADPWIRGQRLDQPIGELGRAHHPNVQHASSVDGPAARGITPRG
jgi:hypothetical protein